MVSVDVTISKVTTVPPTAFGARLSVHVRTAGDPPPMVVPIVTVRTGPEVTAFETVTGKLLLVAEHEIAPSAVQIFDEGVSVNDCAVEILFVGVKLTTRSPPAAPPITFWRVALVHVCIVPAGEEGNQGPPNGGLMGVS